MMVDGLRATSVRRYSLDDVRALRPAIDSRLRVLAPAPAKTDALSGAIRYTLLSPGKRVRPLLTVLTARELGIDGLAVLDAACALEMVHAASLIVDDLPSMDDARQRRGQACTHVAFGEDVAILAAITLLSRATTTLAAAPGLDAETRCALVVILGRAVGTDGLATGQYRDLRACRPVSPIDRIADANHLKTGMLFVAAVEIAAAVAGIDDARLDRLRRFAGHLGQAFQLLDDLVDGITPGAHGAEDNEDSGRTTILSILGRDEVRRRLERHIGHALDDLRPDGPLAAFVRIIFEGHVMDRGAVRASHAAL